MYNGVIERVISSYNCTAHMLLRTRSRPCAPVESPNREKVVLVAMDETLGYSDPNLASKEDGLVRGTWGLRHTV